jgi:bifunctional non-homologous end joining protein LigD
MNRRVIIETREGLQWMVNQAALTFHGWSSRAESLQSPDWVILDLDPGESTKWKTVIDIALAIRKLLEMLELPSIVKTSGQKGIHILVPIAPGHTAVHAQEVGTRIATLVARLYPDDVSLEAQNETRKGRLYLDHLQNFQGKSLVLPYSLRAADGAPVSTPIDWSEVTPKLNPREFTIRTTRARLDAKGDLAAPLLAGTVKLASALARLKQ